MIRQPWHPPYYRAALEQAGMTKAMDLLMWNLEVSDRAKVLPVIFELAEKVRERARHPRSPDAPLAAAQRHGLLRGGLQLGVVEELGLRARSPRRISTPTRRSCTSSSTSTGHDRRERRHGGGRRDGDHRAGRQPGARADERPAAARSAGGTSSTKGRRIDRVRVGFLGVKPEYQHTGVAAQALRRALRRRRTAVRRTGGEMGWILETNTAMNRGMEAMGGRVVKRYRVYERELSRSARRSTLRR